MDEILTIVTFTAEIDMRKYQIFVKQIYLIYLEWGKW